MAAISHILRDEVDEAKNLIGQPNVLFARNREHVTKTHRRLYEVLMPLILTEQIHLLYKLDQHKFVRHL